MKSIVTGGSGFLGRYIVKELNTLGDNITSLSRTAHPELETDRVSSIAVDIRDLAQLTSAFQGADRIFHTAARVGLWGPWDDFYSTNVLGTKNVIKACKRNGVKILVHTSSPSVVFDGSDQRGIDETCPYPKEHLSPYTKSKQSAEELVLRAHGTDGLSSCALRPHLIWGPGDTQLIPRLLNRARRKRLIRIGDGKNRVDITHVKNAAHAHILAAHVLGSSQRAHGKAYFISQGTPVILWDFIGRILDLAHVPPPARTVSFRTAYKMGSLLERLYSLARARSEPLMTRLLAHQLAKDHYYNIEAACHDLGYQVQISTEEGLKELFS